MNTREPKLTLTEIPAIGWKFEDCGFTYTVMEAKPHRTRDGRNSMVVTWQGQCAEGGELFTFKTGSIIRGLARRCPAHNMGWSRAVPFGAPKPAPIRSGEGSVRRFCEAVEAKLEASYPAGHPRHASSDWALERVWDAFYEMFPATGETPAGPGLLD